MGLLSKKFFTLILLVSLLGLGQEANATEPSLKQGEVLLYPISFPQATSALFGGIKIPFFDYAGKKYALIVADVGKLPGGYNLRIKSGDKELEKKLIEVKTGTYKKSVMGKAYKFSTLPKNKQETVVKDKAPLVASLAKAATETKPKLWQAIFANPLASMTTTSPFGYKRIYTNYSTTHRGEDLKAKVGTPVYAISDGVVLWGEGKTLYLEGPMIAIDHGDGIVSEYLHLSKVVVQTGDKVKAGDIIGYSGNQGADVSGAHLHFAIKVGNAAVSPLQFIQEFQKLKVAP